MAITSDSLMETLKAFYSKNGITNLLYKNSPALAELTQTQVSGATAEFAVNYARSAAVGPNLKVVENYLEKNGQVKSFKITPSNLFAGASFGEKELLASNEQRGAYMPIAQVKMFGSCEGYRRTAAMAFYGDGTGFIANVDATAMASVASGADVDVTWDYYQIAYVDIGTPLVAKSTRTALDSTGKKFVVKSINGTTVTLTNTDSATYTAGASDVLCLEGCIDSDGNKLLPIGLEGWLPTTVTSGESFFGVDRSANRDRLAGSHVVATTGEKKYETLKRALLAVEQYQGKDFKILMNNIDAYEMAKEIEDKTYFTKVNGGNGKTKAQVGYADFGFSVNDNFLDHIVKDLYCPKGKAYIIADNAVEIWAFNNVKGLLDSNPTEAKPEIASSDGDKPTRPFQMLVDNIFSVKDGVATENGNVSIVEISTFFNFVCLNPSACASIELA